MAQLSVSKVDKIPVTQVGISKVSVTNKSADAGKVGGKKKKGTNKKVDLGAGSKTFSMQIYTQGGKDNDTLFNIFYNKRTCTIVDKFRGKLKVFIDSVDVTDSDSHIGRTIYDVTCSIQDADFVPTVNWGVKLSSEIEDMEAEVSSMVEEISDDIKSTVGVVETSLDKETNVLSFVDSRLNILQDGIEKMLEDKITVYDYYRQAMARVERTKRLFNTIMNIISLPYDLTKLLINTTGINPLGLQNISGGLSRPRLLRPSQPILYNKQWDEIDKSEVAPSVIAEKNKELVACNIVNRIRVIKNIKFLLSKNFVSGDDFRGLVENILTTYTYCGYEDAVLSDKLHAIKSYATEQEYENIKYVEYPEPQPLVRIVYDYYESLDNYDKIVELNGFKETDYVAGTVIMIGKSVKER